MARPRNAGKQPYLGVYVRAWPCACGKRGYKERSEAKRVIKEMRRQGKLRTDADRVDTYRCESDPDYWHVGHSYGHEGINLNVDPDALSGDGS